MTIVAHTRPFDIGVDTQARTHILAVLAAPTGEVIEGVTTYGALLASLVADTGYQAAEAPRMSARENQEQAGRTRLLTNLSPERAADPNVHLKN